MALDLQLGKPLELPWLAGAVVDLGAQKGVPTPCCRAVRDILALYVDGKPDGDVLERRVRQSFVKSIGLLRSSVAVTFGIGYFRPVAQLNSTQRSVFVTRPSRERLLVRRIGRAAFGAHQEAFLARDLVHGVLNRLVRHRDGEAAGLAHRAQNEEIADRLRHADARRDGVRIVSARGVLDARLVGA